MALPAGPVFWEHHRGVKSHQEGGGDTSEQTYCLLLGSRGKKRSFKEHPSFPEMSSGLLLTAVCRHYGFI